MPSFTAGQAVSVKVNQPFEIRAKVTSGTGYSWRPQGPLPPGIGLLGVFDRAGFLAKDVAQLAFQLDGDARVMDL